MTEAPVCEITLNALLNCLDKYPKKKPVFKNFCKEYSIADLDELTEDLALEVLDIIDNRTYIHTLREKEAYRKQQLQQKLRDAINVYLEANHEDYVVLNKADDCWLLAKRVKLIVYNKNDNSVFQPYETSTTNEYFIVCIIKAAEEFNPPELMARFLSRGCRVVRIHEVGDVKLKLEAIK